MAAAEAKTNDVEAPAPPKIVYATNPEPTIAHGASKDMTDCDYGRLFLGQHAYCCSSPRCTRSRAAQSMIS